MSAAARRMPPKFERLAQYNAERARGIAHTPEYDAEMAELQREFNELRTATIPIRQGET